MSSILDRLGRSVERYARRVSKTNRVRKHALFLEQMRPGPHERIIDIGVASREHSDADNFLEKFYERVENITALTLDPPDQLRARYPRIRVIRGDGRSLPFGDDAFDIVYSNAVIEHVGSCSDQLEFLRELRRCGRRGYLTTPNRLFPVEVHTRTLFLHWLPKSWFDVLLRLIGKTWASGDYMNLLSKRRLKRMLRLAGFELYRIHRNRLFGMTMTFVVVWDKSEWGDCSSRDTLERTQ